MALVTNKTEETNHLRGKSRFYVAGWVANRECEPNLAKVTLSLRNGMKNT